MDRYYYYLVTIVINSLIVLHTAVKVVKSKQGDPKKVLELVIAKCKDFNVGDPKGLTPLDIAINADNEHAVELLIARNAMARKYHVNVTVPTPAKWTALHQAAYENKHRVIAPLSKIIPVNSQETRGKCTPVHVAARYGYANCLKALAKAGEVDWTLTTTSGQTPLHVAYRFRKREAVRSILHLGGYELALTPDASGTSVLDAAPKFGRMGRLIRGACRKVTQHDEPPFTVEDYPPRKETHRKFMALQMEVAMLNEVIR